MSKNENKIIGKIVFEFRYDPIISFYDWRGALAEHLIDELHFDGFHISDKRIDLINPDKNDFLLFVGLQNAGFQLDNNSDKEIAIKKISDFFDALNKFEKFKFKKVGRLGVRWKFLKEKRSSSYDDLKEAFKNNIANLNMTPYKNFKENITDIGMPINFEGVEFNFNIVHGPMGAPQALQFFDNPILYKDVISRNGFYFDIDVFKNDIGEISLEELKEKAIKFCNEGIAKFEIISEAFFANLK